MIRKAILIAWALMGALKPYLCYGAPGEGEPRRGVPEFEHVFVLVEENQNYDDVVGNVADLPYMNSLIQSYGLATNFYANMHPSVNNYFFLTAGRAEFSPFWTSDGTLANMHVGLISDDNVANILTENKKTWKAYLEGLPWPGSLTSGSGAYVKRHAPFAFFSSVVRGTSDYASQRSNLVPFEDNFKKDLQSHTFSNYSFIVPDIYNDSHSALGSHKEGRCGDHAALQRMDQWLNRNIRPLVEDPDFQRGGLLIILFDEACGRGPKGDRRLDPNNPSLRGGGHIPAIIVSSKVKAGARSDRLLHHEAVLRLSLQALGINRFPGAAASAPDLDDLFVSH